MTVLQQEIPCSEFGIGVSLTTYQHNIDHISPKILKEQPPIVKHITDPDHIHELDK